MAQEKTSPRKIEPGSRWNEEPRKDEKTGRYSGGAQNAKLE
jgi:hypothetical protein